MSIILNIPQKQQPYTPLQYISVVMGAVATTTEPSYVASYLDYYVNNSVNNFVSEGTNSGLLTDTTPVTVIATPLAGVNRKMTFLSVSNTDSVANQIIVSMNTVTGAQNTGGTSQTLTIQLFSIILQPGYTLTYNEDGFQVFDINGVLQTGNTTNPNMQIESEGTLLPPRAYLNFFSGLLAQDNPLYNRTDVYPQISGGGGSGSVTSFSAGTANPFFTTSVANPNTTPALSFNINTANSWQLLGNLSGTNGQPPSYVQPNLSTFQFLGQLPVQSGGTGQGLFTQYAVILGNGTGALSTVSGLGTATYVLTSNGAGAAPTWQPASGGVTGSGTQYQVPLWSSSSALTGLTNGSSGTILQSNGTGANPSWVSALANGTTATTQSAGDNSTKIATTAYVNAAVPSTTPQTLTDSAAITWNIASGGNAYLLFTSAVGATRTLTISNPVAGQTYVLEVQQAATGGQAMTFTGITVIVAGAGGGAVTLSVANNAIDVINFYYNGSKFLVTYAVSFT